MDGLLKDILSKVNLYNAPQITWLLELYYLDVNSLLNLVDNWSPGWVNKVIPLLVRKYNGIFLACLKDWMPLMGFLAVTLLVSGISVALLKATQIFF